jgi:hypothetical protein
MKRQDDEKKEKKKKENKKNLLRSPLYMHISKEKDSSAIDHSFQGSMLAQRRYIEDDKMQHRKTLLMHG